MILTYHNVLPRSSNYNEVDLEHFEAQIASLRGCRFVYLDDYDRNDDNQVVIRFDDGYKGIIRHAVPFLKKYNLPFEIFVVEEFVRKGEFGDENFLSINDLSLCVQYGGRLQYHSKSHYDLTKIDKLELLKEEIRCPLLLSQLDEKGFKFFAYPFWKYNKSVIGVVSSFYKGALTGLGLEGNTPFEIPSVRMSNAYKAVKRRKRIAVQLFGHLRTFRNTFGSFKENVVLQNRLCGYNVDIFLHTWNEKEHTTINYRQQTVESLANNTLAKEDIEEALASYLPCSYAVDEQLDTDDEVLIQYNNFPRAKKGCLNLAYTLYRVNELRKRYALDNALDYDWVIVTRPDILFKKAFSLEKIIKCYEDYRIEMKGNEFFYASSPFGRGTDVEEEHFCCGTDLIYFARPCNIDKALSLYQDFETHLKPFLTMEVWWMLYWRKVGLKPVPIKYFHGPDFDIMRTTRPICAVQEISATNAGTGLKTKWWKLSRLPLLTAKALLSLMPYFLVKTPIQKVKKRLGR